MRSVCLSFIAVAAALASSVFAASGHEGGMKRNHFRQQRVWGLRRDPAAGRGTGTMLTAVPSDATGRVTISNTAAAAPRSTAKAVGVDRGRIAPATCTYYSATLGSYCNQSSGLCCVQGLTCVGMSCAYLCTVDSSEPYCDADTPCNAHLGYTCYLNRCRPPSGATRVQIGETCNQGSGNTLFCIPGTAICASGTCHSCTQQS
ncbi:hypothetical protein JCM5296_003542 [Sporobolomyces johnsonii]